VKNLATERPVCPSVVKEPASPAAAVAAADASVTKQRSNRLYDIYPYGVFYLREPGPT